MQNTTQKRNAILALWYNGKSRSVIIQIVALFLVFFSIFYLITNVIVNFSIINKTFGFDFLWTQAGYDIAYTQAMIPFASTDTHFRAAIVGLLGTLNVAFWGILATTIIGFLVGVARLSQNFLISKLAYIYVDTLRNLPILLQILFWYGIFINVMPHPKKAIKIGEDIHIHNSGINMPKPILEDGFMFVMIAFIIAVIGAVFYYRYAKQKQIATGQRSPVFLVNSLLIIGLPVIVFFLMGSPMGFEYPKVTRFKVDGGMILPSQFIGLWFALSTYTAAFIAEIVRAGIQSVNYGQTEAAMALGLRKSLSMRLILIPQAMRVVVPPLASQYLNLTKNSSLAIAVSYFDLVATLAGTTLNQTGREMECMMLTLMVYLIISVSISSFMNWYNQRMALKEK